MGNPSNDGGPATLVLHRSVDDLARAMDWIENQAGECGASPKMVSVLQMVVEEVLANVVMHALPATADLDIQVLWFQPSPGMVRLEIHDSGEEFNPFHVDEPDLTLAAEDREIGGLGIHLVRRYMDLCTYERRDGRNILALVKRLEP